jgi:hypothetical protein
MPHPNKPKDADVYQIWCQGTCPHLKRNEDIDFGDDGGYYCDVFGPLTYYDGSTAECEREADDDDPE